MILIVTNQLDPTADLVIAEFHRRNISFLRFNIEEFPAKVKCSISIDECESLDAHFDFGLGRKIFVSEIKSVYYRRPKAPLIDPKITSGEAKKFVLQETQAAMNGLWMAMDCLWVNHPKYIRVADFKISQLQIAKQLGFSIPKTLVTNEPEKAREFFELCDGKMIAKVLRNGMINYENEIKLIYTTRILRDHLDQLHSVKFAPCLFQAYIPKQTEIRSTIVGNRVFSAEIHSQNSERTRDDWRRYDFANTPHFPHTLPKEIEHKCLQLLKYFKLNFAAIDLILTPEGEYVFLEINPNGQWGWIEALTQLPICQAIVDLLDRN